MDSCGRIRPPAAGRQKRPHAAHISSPKRAIRPFPVWWILSRRHGTSKRNPASRRRKRETSREETWRVLRPRVWVRERSPPCCPGRPSPQGKGWPRGAATGGRRQVTALRGDRPDAGGEVLRTIPPPRRALAVGRRWGRPPCKATLPTAASPTFEGQPVVAANLPGKNTWPAGEVTGHRADGPCPAPDRRRLLLRPRPGARAKPPAGAHRPMGGPPLRGR